MKLYWQICKLLFRKIILHRESGLVVKDFAEAMGIVYIKLAQILATQNYGQLFTESDRKILSSICDNCQPLESSEIKRILKSTYGAKFSQIFAQIDEVPLGSASVSQVHRARLVSGEAVVIKIRRPHITKTIDKEIHRVRRLMHHFGGFIKFKNYSGGDHALELYLQWIRQEADFKHECQNLQIYRQFAQKLNAMLPGLKKVRVPKVYTELCSKDLIVMDYVSAKTVNQLELNPQNKADIERAISSYLKLNFEAMLNGEAMAFHGDPHPGNICIDKHGDLWMLDLGMLCLLDATETKWCRDFFLAVYAQNADKVADLLLQYGNLTGIDAVMLREECRHYCREVHNKNITNYFVDMMGICLKHELVPPDFLFSLAKAFLCLNGISNFSSNLVSAPELLQAQTAKFIIRRTAGDCLNLFESAKNILLSPLSTIQTPGPADIYDFAISDHEFKQNLQVSLNHFREALRIVDVSLKLPD